MEEVSNESENEGLGNTQQMKKAELPHYCCFSLKSGESEAWRVFTGRRTPEMAP